MLNKKLKAAIYIGSILWIVAFVQIGMNALLYSDSNISQAFARNQLEAVGSSVELKVNLGKQTIDKKAWKEEFGKEQEIKVSKTKDGNYLHVKVDTNVDIKSMYEKKERIRSFLDKNNLQEYELATLVECRYKGKMTDEKKKELVQRLFKQCGALTINTKESDDYFVAYGYTLGERDSVTVNGKKVNVNIAINYDEKEGVSHIYIGTPLLNIDF